MRRCVFRQAYNITVLHNNKTIVICREKTQRRRKVLPGEDINDKLRALCRLADDFDKKNTSRNLEIRSGIPGRVVTLVASDDPTSAVWGVAYKIKPEDIDKVTNYLDFREKNGYSKKTVTFHPKDQGYAAFDLTLYIATEHNESFAGPATIQNIAKQVVDCEGPSGPNKEYVYKLASAMRQLAPDVNDDHLFTLEQEVRKLDSSSN